MNAQALMDTAKAVVSEKKRQEGMATVCKPFTKATVKYFDHADAAEARKWSGEA